MKQQKCDWCGRFGARRYVEDRGPNGIGGRITYTYYECATCTARIVDEKAKAKTSNTFSKTGRVAT